MFHHSVCVNVCKSESSLLDITLCLPLCSLSTSQHNHIPLKERAEKKKNGGKQKEDPVEDNEKFLFSLHNSLIF